MSPYGTKKACAHCRNAGGPKLGYCSEIIDSPLPAFDWTTKTHQYFCASRTYAEYCGECPGTGTSSTGSPPMPPQTQPIITQPESPPEQPLNPSAPPSEPPSGQQTTPQMSPSEPSPGVLPERPTAPSSEPQPVQRPNTLNKIPSYDDFSPVQGEGNPQVQLNVIPGTAIPSPEIGPPTFQLPPAFPDGSVPTTNQGTPQTPETRQPTNNRPANTFHDSDAKSISFLPDAPSIPEEFQAGYLNLDENFFG